MVYPEFPDTFSGPCSGVPGCSRWQSTLAIYGFHFRQVAALRVG
jgi:hypothetical protein